MPRWIWILLATSLAALLWAAQRSPSAATAPATGGTTPAAACLLPPGPSAGNDPVQTDVPANLAAFNSGDFTITPLAGIGIQARVLGREDYRLDAGAALSPTDLALGWRQMADPAHYGQLDISQSGRWYHYRWGNAGPPLPLAEIIRSSANMHLIPADATVAQAIKRVQAGQTVRLQGWLVEARRSDGWHWRSSLTREDSGDGSCELIYVCALSSY
ncbi:MAG: hypothetical protein KA187_02190 [Arenimonas sp.]|nr:hypothetical protein [Arenimonas sp.]MBP6626205.1 hypothetical protein [Arenimonas sp.]